MTIPAYSIVPLDHLFRWERLVERLTGWTRIGILVPTFCGDMYTDCEWARDLSRGPIPS